ncbi:MAG TPA: hypothetical protein VJH23_02680 [archaeon]|nr:hypothetical protein [archaeon]
MGFKLIVYGLWFGLAYLLLTGLSEAALPGSLNDTAFTDIGIFSFFAVLILDSLFTLGSVE